MKTKLVILTMLLTLAITLTSHADIPHLINYQGKATDTIGNPLNGAYNLTFRIYNHETVGAPADALWAETHSSITIANGIFSVLLGSVSALDLPFDEDYWLSVEVNTDGEMYPRTRFASVAYAYQAKKADEASHAATADDITRDIGDVPSGGIIMWSGNVANIPEGWAVCDGTNGTPDLRDRFIVGAGNDYLPDTIGGEKEHILTSSEMPSHKHSLPLRSGGGGVFYDRTTGASSATILNSGSTGGGSAHNNLPPYYALLFIMKL